MPRTLYTAALFSVICLSTAQAAQTALFKNLSGSWTGSGPVYVSKFGDVSVSCRVSITGTPSEAAMKGSCGKLLVRQALGLSLRNVGGNRYVGTYTGSKTGPAKLEGILRGNRLVMTVRWGGVVNGDRTAQMVLERTGPNSFAQTVKDSVAGKSRSTSSLVFKRL